MPIPVIAAIPNYDHGASLTELLPQVLEQEYDGVVVCDDASANDDPVHDVTHAYAGDVELVAGDTNVGAGGNRNRILQSRTLERLGDAVIHFVDADTLLLSTRMPERVRDIMADPAIGAAGGLVRDEAGRQSLFNYGPSICGPAKIVHAYGTAAMVLAVEMVRNVDAERARRLRNAADFLLQAWPNPYEEPVARTTDWVIEANMMVRSHEFRQLGGFDPRLRFHEIQDLAARYRQQGQHLRFDPTVEVLQRAIDVRGGFTHHAQEIQANARIVVKATFGGYKPEKVQ